MEHFLQHSQSVSSSTCDPLFNLVAVAAAAAIVVIVVVMVAAAVLCIL